jgi:shikimate dehydrogenase
MIYGLIGEHLGHSFSAEIHARLGKEPYELRELPPDRVEAFLRERDFRGINVTIPYKQTVIPFLDGISETARAIGAVNTVVRRDGKLYGDNTDAAGLTMLLRRTGAEISGKKVLILGTGGTSRTAKYVAESLGASSVIRVSRTAREDAVTYEEAARDHRDARILINTTPCGMYPAVGDCPADLRDYPELEAVADVIYNPLRTNLVLEAREKGIPAEGGLYMLTAQAVRAAELFRGTEYPDGTAAEIFRELLREKENMVLIGMPGSGKTTVGRLLAERANLKFVDTDELIRRRERREVAAIIRERGEREFRQIESLLVCELALTNGSVIATGGGAVLIPNNVTALKMNGEVWFLERAVAELKTTADRPLSDNRDKLNALWDKREPIYRAAADFTANVTDDPQDALLQILNGGNA